MTDDPLPSHSEAESWKALGRGGPTIRALAQLAGERWSGLAPPTPQSVEKLSPEARAILAVARQHGVIELKATNVAFDSTERLLTIHVHLDEHRQMRFRKVGNARWTTRYLEAFRELCAAGLVVHQLYQEFCLSDRGFSWADQIDRNDVAKWIDQGEVVGWTDDA